MLALVQRQPWIAEGLLGRINRFHAAPRAWRVALALLLVAALVLLSGVLVAAAQHRLGSLPDSLRWSLAAGFGALTAAWSLQKIRRGMARHHRGWMQAWPLSEQRLMRQQAVLAGASVLAMAIWPALLAGLLMVTGASSQMALNLAGCCLGVLAGAGLSRLPAVGREAVVDAGTLSFSQTRSDAPFARVALLRNWQRCAINRLSVRRWVWWVAPILMTAPAAVGIQTLVQILLLVMGWPLYARAMAACLETITAGSHLLAATPLTARALCRPLLLRPSLLALSLAVASVIDLTWLGSITGLVAAAFGLILLFEGSRMAIRCRSAHHRLTACVQPSRTSIQRSE